MKTKLLTVAVLSMIFTLSLFGGRVEIVSSKSVVGVPNYRGGVLDSNLNYGIEDVDTALEGAILDLGFDLISQANDSMGSQFIARTTDDKEVTIYTSYMTETYTTLEIQVGRKGDKDLSHRIFETIGARL